MKIVLLMYLLLFNVGYNIETVEVCETLVIFLKKKKKFILIPVIAQRISFYLIMK